MDSYTRRTRAWLDQRFKAVDDTGIYLAHQPIYGFRGFHCEPAIIEKYIRTHQIMKALAQLDFNSLIDIGGAEGYRAYIVREMFGVPARNCDLSEEACKRAAEIFHVESDVADIHDLPYKDDSFDIALCSESLEHLPDFRAGARELLRIARKAVIITVPHEPQETVDHNIEEGVPHGHIHSFDLSSFNFLEETGCRVLSRRMVTPYLRFPSSLLPVRLKDQNGRFPKALYKTYNASAPILSLLLGEWAAAALMRLDEGICAITSRYDAALFVILKQPGASMKRRTLNTSARRVIRFSAPHHFLSKYK